MLKYLREKMKIIMISIVVVFAATMFYGIGSLSLKKMTVSDSDKTVAKINGMDLNPARYNQIMNQMLGQFGGDKQSPETMAYLQELALNQTVEFQILLQDAKKNASVRGEEIDGAISSIMASNKIASQKEFKSILEQRGYKYDDFKNMIKDEILLQKRIRDIREKTKISTDDLREIDVSHILIRVADFKNASQEALAMKKIDEISAKLKAGEDFSTLAKEYSQDPGSKSNGGDLGFFGMGAMVPDFEKAAFALKPGQISDVVKTPYGFHIMKLNETRLKRSADKKDIKEVVLAEKREHAVKMWIMDLKVKAKVEILNNSFRAWDLRMKGRVNEAVVEYNKAIAATPQDAYLHLFLGDCYMDLSQFVLALQEYSKASAALPADPYVHINLATCYLTISKNEKENKSKYENLGFEELRTAASVSGANITLKKQLIDTFKKLGLRKEASQQEDEIKKIQVRMEFEKNISEKLLKKKTP